MTRRALRFLVWRTARAYMDEFMDSPSGSEVARRCGVSATHARRVLRDLRDRGALPDYTPRRDLAGGAYGRRLRATINRDTDPNAGVKALDKLIK